MKLTGENRINASPEEVWRALNDPEILKQAIPGCDTLEKISWTAPEEVKVPGPEERALVYKGGETIEWKVVG